DDDRALLDAWRVGDAQAGSQLLERHFAGVVRFLRAGNNLSRDEVTDLVQKTMLGCVESRDRFPDGTPFRVYLYGIAGRVLANAFRAEYRDRQRAVKAWVDPSARSPSQVAAWREEERLLLGALHQIPRDLQLVVQLHYWERMTMEQIAEVCAVPTGTVKSRLRRARTAVAEQIEAGNADEALSRSTIHGFERWANSVRKHLDE
ncbi:MAG: RNA polymerase sigma factor, partial [Myxococcota bacterium]